MNTAAVMNINTVILNTHTVILNLFQDLLPTIPLGDSGLRRNDGGGCVMRNTATSF
jgi:hypothetical protein